MLDVTACRPTRRIGLHTLSLSALLAASLLFTNACARSEPAATPLNPVSTVKDLMDSIVDPSADALWDSVEVVATLEGTEHKAPRTDDDWKALRRHAIALVEAGNLLVIPGRHVAKPGEMAEDARVDLHPEEIEALLVKDPAAWLRHARGLQNAAAESLKAIDARDVTALMNAGEVLDAACESCHRSYWYRTPPSGDAQTGKP